MNIKFELIFKATNSTCTVITSIFLLVLPLPIHAKERTCNLHQIPKKPSNARSCEAAGAVLFKADECIGTTAGMRELTAALNKCFTFLMNKDLDTRLLQLKTKDPAQFKSEMEIQKHFNLGIKAQCGRYYNCKGSMYPMLGDDCYLSFTKARALQATLILNKKLGLGNGEPQGHWLPEMQTFVQKFCEMPAEVWQEKKAPKDCVSKALAYFEADKSIGKPPKDPCAEEEQ